MIFKRVFSTEYKLGGLGEGVQPKRKIMICRQILQMLRVVFPQKEGLVNNQNKPSTFDLRQKELKASGFFLHLAWLWQSNLSINGSINILSLRAAFTTKAVDMQIRDINLA